MGGLKRFFVWVVAAFSILLLAFHILISVATASEADLSNQSELRLASLEKGYQSDPGGLFTPDIAIAKTPDSQTVAQGGTASFTITITNTGDVTLFNVAVSDPLAPTCNNPAIGTMPAGDTREYSCTLTNISQSFLNEATASGQDFLGGTVSDKDTAFVNVVNPNIAIVKSPDRQTILSGGTAAFTILVLNTSSTIDLVDIVVSDPLAPTCNRTIPTLEADSNFSYTCPQPNVTTGFTNLATATGVNPNNGESVSDSDVAIVEVLDIAAELEAVPANLIEPGGNVVFTATVTNRSSKNVTLVSLASDPYGDLTDPGNTNIEDSSCASDVALAAQDGDYACSFTANVSGQPSAYNITLMATAEDNSGNTVSDSDNTLITITDAPQFPLYLPALANNIIAGEPNDFPCAAYSVLINRDYHFLADDAEDWYVFDLTSSGNLVVEVTNYLPPNGQIIVYRGTSCNANDLTLLASNGVVGATTRIVNAGAQPAGTYYIRVFSPSTATAPYRLLVRFP